MTRSACPARISLLNHEVVYVLVRYYRPLRVLFLAGSDAFIVFLSLVVSIFLYTRAIALPYEWSDIFAIFGCLYAVQLLAFAAFGIHRVSFQYANVLAAGKIAVILIVAWAVTFMGLRESFGQLWPPTIAVLQRLGRRRSWARSPSV